MVKADWARSRPTRVVEAPVGVELDGIFCGRRMAHARLRAVGANRIASFLFAAPVRLASGLELAIGVSNPDLVELQHARSGQG